MTWIQVLILMLGNVVCFFFAFYIVEFFRTMRVVRVTKMVSDMIEEERKHESNRALSRDNR